MNQETAKKSLRELQFHYDKLIIKLNDDHKGCRELAIANTKLEESWLWAKEAYLRNIDGPKPEVGQTSSAS